MDDSLNRLRHFFEKNDRLGIAFSGGVDSSFLLYFAKKQGSDIHPYYVESEFQPRFELEEALRISSRLNVELNVLNISMIDNPGIMCNDLDRCYICKKHMMSVIVKNAKEDGCSCIYDGTNSSDLEEERPGMRALDELGIESPLKEAGIDKSMIREYSKSAGLDTYDKPSYSCLATRIATGMMILPKDLERVEMGEGILRKLGLKDLRLRIVGPNEALLQIEETEYDFANSIMPAIKMNMSELFDEISLDSKPRMRK